MNCGRECTTYIHTPVAHALTRWPCMHTCAHWHVETFTYIIAVRPKWMGLTVNAAPA